MHESLHFGRATFTEGGAGPIVRMTLEDAHDLSVLFLASAISTVHNYRIDRLRCICFAVLPLLQLFLIVRVLNMLILGCNCKAMGSSSGGDVEFGTPSWLDMLWRFNTIERISGERPVLHYKFMETAHKSDVVSAHFNAQRLCCRKAQAVR